MPSRRESSLASLVLPVPGVPVTLMSISLQRRNPIKKYASLPSLVPDELDQQQHHEREHRADEEPDRGRDRKECNLGAGRLHQGSARFLCSLRHRNASLLRRHSHLIGGEPNRFYPHPCILKQRKDPRARNSQREHRQDALELLLDPKS